jgi:hypothetical protein
VYEAGSEDGIDIVANIKGGSKIAAHSSTQHDYHLVIENCSGTESRGSAEKGNAKTL